jgi:hypothetical protein
LIHRTLLLAFGLLMSSCATVTAEYKLDPTKPLGLVIGSVTYERTIGVHGLVVLSQDGKQVRSPSVGYGIWSPFNKPFDEKLAANGGTYAVELPAGQYRIVGWRIVRAQTTYQSNQPVDVPFVVEPGKSTYLGNLHFSEHWDVTLRDRADRDLPVLKARFPTLASSPLAVSIAAGTEVEKFGGGYVGRTEMPVFVPVPGR